jgi:uncharacterized protein (TIGR00730 family)
MAERKISNICVFCGSASGSRPVYAEKAQTLGAEMARRAIRMVYGGGGIGLMGEVALGVIESGGEVTGVIPYALATKERLLPNIEMRVVNTMHERKAIMAREADAFIILPGGFGTFDEMFEIITWAQLGIHQKPIGILNIEGYFDSMMQMIEHAIREGFILPRFRDLMVVSREIVDLLEKLERHTGTEGIVKWVEMKEA